MDPVEPRYLLFNIWAMTQTYADFEVQVCAVLNKRLLSAEELDKATDSIVTLLLKGCGVREI